MLKCKDAELYQLTRKLRLECQALNQLMTNMDWTIIDTRCAALYSIVVKLLKSQNHLQIT